MTSRSRVSKFILCVLLLVAALLWIRREQLDAQYEAEQIVFEARMVAARERRTAELGRIWEAEALVDKAYAATDPAEQNRLYDEIIAAYKDDDTTYMVQSTAWARWKKSQLAETVEEKQRQLGGIIEDYCHMTDPYMYDNVGGAILEMLKLAGENADRAGKTAYCDSTLEKYGSRLTDSLTALLLNEKAKATRNSKEKAAIYDDMLARFLPSKEENAFGLAVGAARNKIELVHDTPERLRLCGIVIDAYLKAPERIARNHFRYAVQKKAEIVKDPSFPLALWNQVIAAGTPEEAVAQARWERLLLLKDNKERLAACDELIAAHENSANDSVRYTVVRAMMRKAQLLPRTGERNALYRAVLERSANIRNSRVRSEADHAASMLSTMRGGDNALVIRYYSEAAANAKNDRDAIRALERKARLLEDRAEKNTIYDAIIARGNAAKDRRLQKDVLDAMLAKAKLLDDKDGKIRLLDEIIAKGSESKDKDSQAVAANAMIEKADSTDDSAEKIALYDKVLFGGRRGNRLSPFIFRNRLELAADPEEKARLFDRYFAANGRDMSLLDIMSMLLDKAEAVDNPADKARLYDEAIAFYEPRLKAEENDGEQMRMLERAGMMRNFGRAVLGRAELLESAEEKIALYDRYLAFPPSESFFVVGRWQLEQMLAKKAELSGDLSALENYYDGQIRKAATDSERIDWYSSKARAVGETKRAAVEEEMISTFLESTDERVERTIADLLLRKIRRTGDPAEKMALCDRLLARYGESPNGDVLDSVVRALLTKAEATEDAAAQLALYTALIDRYKDSDDHGVKRTVDEAVAARFRLEEKLKTGR